MLVFNPYIIAVIILLVAAVAYYAIGELKKAMPKKENNFELSQNNQGQVNISNVIAGHNESNSLNLNVSEIRNYKKYSKEETMIYSSANALTKLRVYLRLHLNSKYNLLNETEYLVLALIGFVIGGAVGFWAIPNVISILIVATVGLITPEIYLSFQVKGYRIEINKQSVILTQLVIQAMRTGVGIAEAFERAGEQLKGPIEKEIEVLSEYFHSGFTFQEAAREAQKSTASVFLKKIYQVIIMSLETNVSPDKLIERLAIVRKNLIAEYYLKEKMRSEASGGNLAKNILIVVVPGLLFFVVKNSPKVVSPLLETPMGWFVIAAGIGLYSSGIIVSNKIMKSLDV